MNLAYFYPIIFWNTANLIVDSGAQFKVEEEEEDEDATEDVEEILEEEEDELETGRATVSNYGKIASAIGKMQKRGIQVLPPDDGAIIKPVFSFCNPPKKLFIIVRVVISMVFSFCSEI